MIDAHALGDARSDFNLLFLTDADDDRHEPRRQRSERRLRDCARI